MRRQFVSFMLPPKKAFRWNALYSIIVLMALIHLGLFTLFGVIIPKIPKQKIDLFTVDLVKNVKKKKLTKPKPMKEKKVKSLDRKKSKKKPPGPKKPKPLSNAKPPKKDNAAPNLPLKIDLPKQKYPRLNPDADSHVYRPPENAHELGAPSGKPDGILGSKGTDGDIKGEGGGDGTGGGGGGGGGDGGGDGTGGGGAGGFVPYIDWDYQGTKYGRGRQVLSSEESRKMYMQFSHTHAFLVNACGPTSDRELIELGNGSVELRVTVPAVGQVPEHGISPNYTIVSVNPDDPSKKEFMTRVAHLCMKNSGWYPAKKNGQPFEETFTLILYFRGRYELRN